MQPEQQRDRCCDDAGSLKDLIAKAQRGQPIPRSDVLRYGIHVARGVHHLHLFHIVHRDIKPDNIFLGRFPNTAWPPCAVDPTSAVRGVYAAPDFPQLAQTGQEQAAETQHTEQPLPHEAATYNASAPAAAQLDFKAATGLIARLGDPGIAVPSPGPHELLNGQWRSWQGTTGYKAPETLPQVHGSHGTWVGQASDIWSLGVVIWELWYQRPWLKHFLDRANGVNGCAPDVISYVAVCCLQSISYIA